MTGRVIESQLASALRELTAAATSAPLNETGVIMTYEREEWKPVPSHEGSYEVSNRARVRSLDRDVGGKNGMPRRVKGRVLTPRIRPGGVPCVNLWRDNEYRQRPIRDLVVEAFNGAVDDMGESTIN